MATTYKLIDKANLTGTQSVIDFTSIPSTYTDLLLVVSLRDNGSNVYSLAYAKFNNTTANLKSRGVEGDGSSPTSYYNSTVLYINSANGNSTTANTFCNTQIYIPNYTSSNYKSVSVDGVMENNATTSYSSLQAGLWSDTSVINQITLYSTTGSWVSGSSAYLYGIKNS
jgi:hypothetical protein